MVASHMHFFRDLYVKLRTSGVLSVTPETLRWRQNEAREKTAQRVNQLVKLELVLVSKKVIL